MNILFIILSLFVIGFIIYIFIDRGNIPKIIYHPKSKVRTKVVNGVTFMNVSEVGGDPTDG